MQEAKGRYHDILQRRTQPRRIIQRGGGCDTIGGVTVQTSAAAASTAFSYGTSLTNSAQYPTPDPRFVSSAFDQPSTMHTSMGGALVFPGPGNMSYGTYNLPMPMTGGANKKKKTPTKKTPTKKTDKEVGGPKKKKSPMTQKKDKNNKTQKKKTC